MSLSVSLNAPNHQNKQIMRSLILFKCLDIGANSNQVAYPQCNWKQQKAYIIFHWKLIQNSFFIASVWEVKVHSLGNEAYFQPVLTENNL